MSDHELLSAISDMLESKFVPVNERLDRIEATQEALKEDVGNLKKDVAGMKEDIRDLKEDVAVLKKDVADLKEDVAILKVEVSGLKEDVVILKTEVNSLKENDAKLQADVSGLKDSLQIVKLTLENETNKKIDIIGEGHDFLKRHLHEALQMEKKNEQMELEIMNLRIKTRNMEQDIKDIKQHLDIA